MTTNRPLPAIIARRDHLLNYWGDIFCNLKIRAKLDIKFADFIRHPDYYLRRLRNQQANTNQDHLLNYWGDQFCAQDIATKSKITFAQFLKTPNRYITASRS